MSQKGKDLLLKTAENIENKKATFRSNRNQGILYNIMLFTDYGYEALYDEHGFYGLLWNGKKGMELDSRTILPRVSEEIALDEHILREFVGWCNKQVDEQAIINKLREMYAQFDTLTIDDFTV